MADDRVMIKCSACGAFKMLMKHYAGVGPLTQDNGILEWLDLHGGHHKDFHCGDLRTPGFTLHLEREIGEEGGLDPTLLNK